MVPSFIWRDRFQHARCQTTPQQTENQLVPVLLVPIAWKIGYLILQFHQLFHYQNFVQLAAKQKRQRLP